MNLTQNQTDCLEKARRYQRKNFTTVPFGKLYLRFCDDGFVKAQHFLGLVSGSNVHPMQPKVHPTMDVNKFVQRTIDHKKEMVRQDCA